MTEFKDLYDDTIECGWQSGSSGKAGISIIIDENEDSAEVVLSLDVAEAFAEMILEEVQNKRKEN